MSADVPITVYFLSGFSATCLLTQVVLPLPGRPTNMIISQSSRFSILNCEKIVVEHEETFEVNRKNTWELQTKRIEPGSSSDRVCCSTDAGETFERCKPSFTVSSVLGLAKVYFKLDVSGAERQLWIIKLITTSPSIEYTSTTVSVE